MPCQELSKISNDNTDNNFLTQEHLLITTIVAAIAAVLTWNTV